MKNFGLEHTHAIVRLFQWQLLVHFQVLLYMQVPVQILDTDVVHVQVVAGRDGANPVENIFRRRGPRDGVDHNVCVRKQAMHSAGHLVGNLAGALESYVARQPDRDIRKVAVAGTADAHTVHFEQALHTLQGSDDLATRANRSGVEKRVYGATRQARADENDNTGHEESGDWVSLNQPGPARNAQLQTKCPGCRWQCRRKSSGQLWPAQPTTNWLRPCASRSASTRN